MDICFCLVVAALLAHAQVSADSVILDAEGVKVRLENNTNAGFNLVLERGSGTTTTEVIAVIGRLASSLTAISSVAGSSVAAQFGDGTNFTITSREVTGSNQGYVLSVTWNAPKTTTLEDCVNYGSYNWYGGPQQKRQYWPIENLDIRMYSYVTKEADNCGVAERYWLSSSGIFYFFDQGVPLFVDSKNRLSDAVCFIAQVTAPYSSGRSRNFLSYDIAIFDDVRKAHEYAIAQYLKKPTGYPDELMIKYPIWSTWARYKTLVNHDVVLAFADEITQNGFPNSQFEIDDLWEICYGSLTVDVLRFPSMKNTIDILRTKGYRTTMWAHPFLNKGCEPWYTDAKNAGYIVSSEDNTVETSWWNDNGTTSSYVDFTKEAARKWYMDRLYTLQNETGVDAFKFDGGESSWSPQIPVLQGTIEAQPNIITSDYVRTVAAFGSLVEVRAGFQTQDLPIFVRMIDKDTYWTFENGLPTLITTMFQMNLNGYPLVLPDMIGGNGYNEPPSKELFIRWLQANTFMPSLQFSYVPWNYDNETITISKKFVELHAEYAPTIIAACKKAVSDGSPVNAPIWWIAPTDKEAHKIWDEYLLGETILVAPVVTPNATTRNIYLPEGTWYEQGDQSRVISGPVWLTNYSAPLDVLPFFVSAGQTALYSVFLVVLGLILNIL